MKKSIFFCISILILSVSFLCLMSNAYITVNNNAIDKEYKNVPVIILDPGHGDFDGGTVGEGNILEKDINLQISKKIYDILTVFGFKIEMTREDDSSTCDDNLKTIRKKKVSDLKNRLKMANKYENSIFISIHQNNFSNCKYYGSQVFYSTNNPNSKILAEHIKEAITKLIQPNNEREIKPAGSNIFILKNAKNPAIIVECGFMSNQNELNRLCSDYYQNQIAFSICSGIANYLKIL